MNMDLKFEGGSKDIYIYIPIQFYPNQEISKKSGGHGPP